MRVAMLVVEVACMIFFVARGDALWAAIAGVGAGFWLDLVIDSAAGAL